MARKVGAAKAGHYELADGTSFGAKELNALVSRHNKTLKQLKKNYTARGSRKKRSPLTKSGAVRKTGDGFKKGSYLRPELVAFLQNANFGSVNGPTGGASGSHHSSTPSTMTQSSRSLTASTASRHWLMVREDQRARSWMLAGP